MKAFEWISDLRPTNKIMGSTDHLGYMYAALMGIGGMIHLEETRVTEQRQQKIKMQMGKQKSVKATVKAFHVQIKPPMGIFLGALAVGGAYHVRMRQFSVLR